MAEQIQRPERTKPTVKQKVLATLAGLAVVGGLTYGGIEYAKYVDRTVAELKVDLETQGATLHVGDKPQQLPKVHAPNADDGLEVVMRGSKSLAERDTYASPGKPAVIEFPADFTDHGEDRLGMIGKYPMRLHDVVPGPPVQSWVLEQHVDPTRQADIAVHVGLNRSIPDLSASLRYDAENNLVVDFAMSRRHNTVGVEALILVSK